MKKKQAIKKKTEESSIEDLSDNEESVEVKSEMSFEEDEIDINERRIQVAQKLISEAKSSIKGTKRVKTGDEDVSSSESVDDQKVAEYLQNKVTEKKQTKQLFLFEKIKEAFDQKEKKVKELNLKAHKRPITACCFNPVNNDLISVGKDGAIVSFNAQEEYKRVLLNPGYPKSPQGHRDEILCLDISFDGKYLITAGKDKSLKVWDLNEFTKQRNEKNTNIKNSDSSNGAHEFSDLKNKLVKRGYFEALKITESIEKNKGKKENSEIGLLFSLDGHRDSIHSAKFRLNSYECVTVSADRALKVWDVSQGGLIETFYGHRNEIQDIDAMGTNMISVGFDKLSILFKLDKETQMVFDEQMFSVDCVKGINPHFFVTGSQDGQVSLWNVGKRRPLQTFQNIAPHGWVSSLGGVYNSDLLISGSVDSQINFWKLNCKNTRDFSIKNEFSIPAQGVIVCLSVSHDGDCIAVIESPENRLGRWTVFDKVKPKIRLFKILNP